MDLDNIYIYSIGVIFCIWLIVSELKFLKIMSSDEDEDEDEFTYRKNKIRSINILISSTIGLILFLWFIYSEV